MSSKPNIPSFNLSAADLALIKGGLRLGDWILKQELTDKKKKAVVKIQEMLQLLPTPLVGFDLAYEVNMTFQYERFPFVIYRSWCVALCRPNYPSLWLEIFSTWTPERWKDEHGIIHDISCPEQAEHELSFFRKLEDSMSDKETYYQEEWLREVDILDDLKIKASEFGVDAYCVPHRNKEVNDLSVLPAK